MVHQRYVFNTAASQDPASRGGERRTAASYERDLAEHRGRESQLRAELERKEALLRRRGELIHRREVLSQEADHRLLNGLQMVVSLLSMQSCSPRFAVAFT